MIEKAGLGLPVFQDHVKPIAAYTDLAFDKWLDSLILGRRGEIPMPLPLPPPRRNNTAAEKMEDDAAAAGGG